MLSKNIFPGSQIDAYDENIWNPWEECCKLFLKTGLKLRSKNGEISELIDRTRVCG